MMESTFYIIILYFLVLFVLALLAKRAKGSSDFSVAKNKLPLILIISGSVMNLYGGGFVLGGAELGYKYGFCGLVYGFSSAIGLLLLGFLLYKKIYQIGNKEKVHTIPEFLLSKFKSRKVSFVAGLLSILALTAIASAQLFAASKIFDAIGFNPKISSLVLAILVALTAKKGIKAITQTGKYNLIIASVGAVISLILASTLKNNITLTPVFETMNFNYLLGIFIPTIFYILIGQDVHQKLYSANKEIDVKKACLISALILFLLSFFPMLIGMKAHYLFNIEAVQAMPQFILFTLPSIFKGLFLAAILAAVIGSMQSVINAAATQVSEDIIKPFKKLSDFELGKISSTFAIILSFIAFDITLFSSSIIDNIILAYAIYTSGLFIPIMAGFFLKDAQRIRKIIFPLIIISMAICLLFEFNIITWNIPSIVPGILVSFLIVMVYLFRKRSSSKFNS
jgi:Na+/proline symporter